jgi:hypothetical protein
VDTGGEQHFILLDNIGITPVTVEIPADAGSEGRTQGYFGPEGVSELGTTRVASSRIGSISNKLNRNKPLFAPPEATHTAGNDYFDPSTCHPPQERDSGDF